MDRPAGRAHRARRVLVVDGANVVGSVPDGWWRDRPRAAARLHGRLAVADVSFESVVLVLEGQARGGVPAGTDGHLRTVHAPRDGDATIVAEARTAVGQGHDVVVVTADRGLATQVDVVGARTMSPSWLLDQIS